MAENNHMSTRRLSLLMLAFGIFLVKVTGQKCQVKVDIVILLDSSGSVGLDNFDKVKQFLINSTIGFTVGPTSIQIGLVTFSPPQTQFSLNTFSSSSDVQNGINNVPYKGGTTDTHLALRYVGHDSFTVSAGDRVATPDLLVVITDGQSSNTMSSVEEADILKQRKIKIMAIGIGSNINKEELLGIASDSSIVFEVKDFDALPRFTNEIRLISCGADEIITHTNATLTTTSPSISTFKTSTTSTAPLTSTTYTFSTTLTSRKAPTTTATSTIPTTSATSKTPTNPTTSQTDIFPIVSSTTEISLTAATTSAIQTTTIRSTSIIKTTKTTFPETTSIELPVIKVPQYQYTTKYGQKVTIECKVISYRHPILEVFWKKFDNGISVTIHSTTSGIEGVTKDNPSLSINKPMENSTYTCNARNAVGTQHSTEVYLSVIGGPPTVTVHVSSYSTIFGSSIVLNCTVHSDLDLKAVYWKVFNAYDKDNARIKHLDWDSAGVTKENPALSLQSPKFYDSGEYFCYARNDAGPSLSTAISLKVNGGIPEVKIGSFFYTANYGEAVTLDCTIVSSPPHFEVYWIKKSTFYDGIIIIRPGESVETSGGTTNMPSLTINIARSSDIGSYVCVVENLVGTGLSHETELKVNGGVPIVKRTNEKYKTGKGYSVTINCIVTSEYLEIQNVYWTVYNTRTNKTNLIRNGEVGIDGVTVHHPSLIINDVSVSMEGEYRCCATNIAGDACGLPSDLIVKPQVDLSKEENENGNKVEQIEKIVGIIGGVIAILGALSTVCFYIRKRNPKNKKTDNDDKICCCLAFATRMKDMAKNTYSRFTNEIQDGQNGGKASTLNSSATRMKDMAKNTYFDEIEDGQNGGKETTLNSSTTRMEDKAKNTYFDEIEDGQNGGKETTLNSSAGQVDLQIGDEKKIETQVIKRMMEEGFFSENVSS